MNKKISLIFFLTIILKPIFTKIAFPLCEIGDFFTDSSGGIKRLIKRVSTAECDSFGQHILSPFYHFEFYFIIITILTYLMWYFGYINFDNIDQKRAFKNNILNNLIPKSINLNKIKINNIFSLRNIKIFFSLLLLFIPAINIIYVIIIYKKYRKWLKNEIISQTKLNKVLTIILIFTFTGVNIYRYSNEPQLLLGIPMGILILYHIPRIIAYILLHRLSIVDVTKTYNKTITVINVLMLLIFSLALVSILILAV